MEVRFFPVAGGTRLELTHAGWEAIDAQATDYRSNYEGGWEGVLDRFVAGAGKA